MNAWLRFRSFAQIRRGPPFFNCWFLSLGHLLVLLDDVEPANANESFKKALFSTRHVTTGCLDFASQYFQAKELRASAAVEHATKSGSMVLMP